MLPPKLPKLSPAHNSLLQAPFVYKITTLKIIKFVVAYNFTFWFLLDINLFALQKLLHHCLHRLTRAHSPLLCAMDK